MQCLAVLAFIVFGLFAGIWGAIAGGALGLCLLVIVNRLLEERRWRQLLESGSMQSAGREPFAGAAYLCGIIVYCIGDASVAASLLARAFTGYTADWRLLCRACAAAHTLNGDLLVECFVAARLSSLGKEGDEKELLQHIFTVLNAAECAWDDARRGVRPSHYVASLLEYTVRGSEIASSYAVLGLTPDASFSDVRHAYRKLAAMYHPDHATHPSRAVATDFMRVQQAYECIIRQAAHSR
ncbi:MAG: J domain-containing protein [Treponema sp.]|nr:J domain-containing protein [Treponema sp.]